MVSTIFRSKVAQKAQYVFLHMPTFSWKNLKKLHIYPYVRNISTFYCRFINDFLIKRNKIVTNWRFIGNFNKKHLTIKFESTYSKSSITVLDTKIYKNRNGIFCSTINRKSIDRRNFAQYDLAHPKKLERQYTIQSSVIYKTYLLWNRSN